MNTLVILTVIALTVIAAGAVIYTAPARALAKRQLSEEENKQLNDITETAVRWAKQWLDTATGAEKKEEVLRYLEEKTSELGLNITADDIDKAIEAAYEKVKKETESKQEKVSQGDYQPWPLLLYVKKYKKITEKRFKKFA